MRYILVLFLLTGCSNFLQNITYHKGEEVESTPVYDEGQIYGSVRIFDLTENADLKGCKFIRTITETPGGPYGGYIGQEASKEKIADRAQDYGIDTVDVYDSSILTGSVSVRGYRCKASAH